MSEENSLPTGWVEVSVNDINLHKSQNIKPFDFEDEIFELYSVPVFPTKQAEKLEGREIGSSKQVVKPNDVLLCKINPRINRVWVVPQATDLRQIASSEWINIRSPLMSSSFLKYTFTDNNFRERLCSELTGVGGSLTRAQPKKVGTYTISIPPLNEQKRIADKLDSLLAKVDAVNARLDSIPTLLKRFRQSVLAAATSGELTKEWRDNKTQTWQAIKLEKIIKDGPKNGIYKPSKLYGTGTKIVRIDCFYDGFMLDWDILKRVRLSDKEVMSWSISKNDLLINRVNSIEYLGKCALIEHLPENAVFESNIMKISITDEAIPSYIRYFLSSPNGLNELRKNAKHAVNQASINQNDVKSCRLLLPPLKEQKEIVQRIESLFALADHVEQQYTAAKARTDKLTQALLAKAFRGELVPQDPTDEPASKLLTRIQAERDALAKAEKQRKAAARAAKKKKA